MVDRRSYPARGVASPHAATAEKRAAVARARVFAEIVLASDGGIPSAEIADNIAARVTAREVTHAINVLAHKLGLIAIGADRRWRTTEAGRAKHEELMRAAPKGRAA